MIHLFPRRIGLEAGRSRSRAEDDRHRGTYRTLDRRSNLISLREANTYFSGRREEHVLLVRT